MINWPRSRSELRRSGGAKRAMEDHVPHADPMPERWSDVWRGLENARARPLQLGRCTAANPDPAIAVFRR